MSSYIFNSKFIVTFIFFFSSSVSECYFAVKGAALVLPHDECLHVHRKTIANGSKYIYM